MVSSSASNKNHISQTHDRPPDKPEVYTEFTRSWTLQRIPEGEGECEIWRVLLDGCAEQFAFRHWITLAISATCMSQEAVFSYSVGEMWKLWGETWSYLAWMAYVPNSSGMHQWDKHSLQSLRGQSGKCGRLSRGGTLWPSTQPGASLPLQVFYLRQQGGVWRHSGGSNAPNLPLGGRKRRCWRRPHHRLPLLIRSSHVWLSNLYSVKNNSIINSSTTSAKTREYISWAGASTEHFVQEDDSIDDSSFIHPFKLLIRFNLTFKRQKIAQQMSGDVLMSTDSTWAHLLLSALDRWSYLRSCGGKSGFGSECQENKHKLHIRRLKICGSGRNLISEKNLDNILN